MKKMLPKEFYLQDTLVIAKELLGKKLVFIKDSLEYSGMIVETEAYTKDDDLANHASKGITQRNSAMFEDGGILYIYQIYGIYYCINVVTETKGVGTAVLIRAIEPLNGIENMKKNRQVNDIYKLCNGPGKLSMAMRFNLSDNFTPFLSSSLYIENYINPYSDCIYQTKRIGIKQSIDLPYRFYLKNSNYISKG